MEFQKYNDSNTIRITADGVFFFQNKKLAKEDVADIINNIQPNGIRSSSKNQEYILELEDMLFYIDSVSLHSPGILSALNKYGIEILIPLDKLSLNEWDRLQGILPSGISFAFSKAAQEQIFELCEDYDDDSLSIAGKQYHTPPWYIQRNDVTQNDWWSQQYASQSTGWDMQSAHPAFAEAMLSLKLNRSRIAVLGCGKGHDAAYLSKQGHIVSAFDFSEQAIQEAKNLYKENANLKFYQQDVFKMTEDFKAKYDLVVDHTLYCAVDPAKRESLVKIWRNILVEGGNVLGIFFSMPKPMGPPWGGSEWELKMRVQKNFRPLFWNRIRTGPGHRLGCEFVCYLEKLS